MSDTLSVLPELYGDGYRLLAGRFPKVMQQLEAAASSWNGVDTPGADCQKIGLKCRDAIIKMADAVYSPDFATELGLKGKEVPKDGAAHEKLKVSVSYLQRFEESESLRNLLKEVWAFAMATQHDDESTPERASRCLLWTSLALIEIARFMHVTLQRLAFYEQHGVFKCEVCGTLDLELFWEGDQDGAWSFVKCTKCNWIDY